ncbi:MAG: aquaporin [Bifidobacterium tibiigranuli]|jgi:aquaporin Z|uniref:MIP/aquaporin family protein n=1 Tax=Bifidobacterium tibiigranuli TaxID=2172043 RepID=UPI0023564A52|nr:aquaporin [Bifidobacterium tibiigranuli]MCH3975258.1 aquaporin [Bifidobacterium tibiigranuli]MCH4190287.1 aquaporin [Bifidobacterium tibiigranuli]MCH4203456.1 aquaporin [Bifidobacterium tibiigranuli]MCH4273932.1 aquaporin [Bifidobacterium tibiigranuli]MCI1791172.1 aquaporin [Bifidobacterium tibiigranuli]
MNLRKYVAEFIGTAILVLIGTGAVAGSTTLTGATGLKGSPLALSTLVIALAFGISIIIAAYSIGNVSGAVLNPALTLGMLIDGRLTVTDFVGYIVAQVLGALAGSGLLVAFTGSNKSLGANGYGDLSALNTGVGAAFLIETVLTFFFMLVVLGVTAKPEFSSVAGVVIGLTLSGLILIGLPFTGVGVNPARSFAPALLTGGEALSQVWLFIVAPLVGAALGALVHRYVLAPVYLDKKD